MISRHFLRLDNQAPRVVRQGAGLEGDYVFALYGWVTYVSDGSTTKTLNTR